MFISSMFATDITFALQEKDVPSIIDSSSANVYVPEKRPLGESEPTAEKLGVITVR